MAQVAEQAVDAVETVNPLQMRLTQKKAAFEVAKESLAKAIEIEAQVSAEIEALADDANALQSAKEQAQGRAVDTIAKGMIDGLFTKDEATALYGDAFGYKPKKDGTPGKTPAGSGETLRKRSVLLSEAASLASGAPIPLPKWAEGKSDVEIAETVNQWLSGELSCWQAYKDLTTKGKKAATPLHFDEKKLLTIVQALQDKVTLESIKDSPALAAVYDALADAWKAAE